jgi:hypothetical protein
VPAGQTADAPIIGRAPGRAGPCCASRIPHRHQTASRDPSRRRGPGRDRVLPPMAASRSCAARPLRPAAIPPVFRPGEPDRADRQWPRHTGRADFPGRCAADLLRLSWGHPRSIRLEQSAARRDSARRTGAIPRGHNRQAVPPTKPRNREPSARPAFGDSYPGASPTLERRRESFDGFP